MALDPELFWDLLRLAGERGILCAEDIEVVTLAMKSGQRPTREIVADFTVKMILRIRAQRGDPPSTGVVRQGEVWRWYVENGGAMPLDSLEGFDEILAAAEAGENKPAPPAPQVADNSPADATGTRGIRFNGGPFDGMWSVLFGPANCPEMLSVPVDEFNMRGLTGKPFNAQDIQDQHPNQAAIYRLHPTADLGAYFFVELVSMEEHKRRHREMFGCDPGQFPSA